MDPDKARVDGTRTVCIVYLSLLDKTYANSSVFLERSIAEIYHGRDREFELRISTGGLKGLSKRYDWKPIK